MVSASKTSMKRYNQGMKLRNGIVGLAFAAVTLALAQDAFSPVRTYAVGDKDVYGCNMKMDGGLDVSFVFKQSFVVKKVYENGDADVETKVFERTLNVAGQASKQPDADTLVVRYDKFFIPAKVTDPSKPQPPAFMSFIAYRSAQTVKIGQVINIDEDLKDKLNTHVKGTSKLDSITDGIAKMITSVDIKNAKTKKPMHLDSISYLDVKTSKLTRAESKVSNVESDEIPGVKTITVVLERETK